VDILDARVLFIWGEIDPKNGLGGIKNCYIYSSITQYWKCSLVLFVWNSWSMLIVIGLILQGEYHSTIAFSIMLSIDSICCDMIEFNWDGVAWMP
jgi:hypothetical protein